MNADALSDYDGYLARAHGARASTRAVYLRLVGNFLNYVRSHELGPEITAQVLHAFVAESVGQQHKPATIQNRRCAVKSYLRYLAVRGECAANLVDALPRVPNPRLAGLPKILTAEQVGQLLTSFDASKPTGMRDKAMALCMVDLGLRAGEVAALSLDDMNWRSGLMRLSTTKGRRESQLPLTSRAGSALAAYIRAGRPATGARHIFVQHPRAPRIGAPLSSSAIRTAIRRAWKRSGASVPSCGTHALRHTLATRILSEGATLKAVADLLRHRTLDATQIYTKVNLTRLVEVAAPWPEVVK